MSKDQIKQLIERHLPEAGLIETALKGVRFFHVTEAIPCAPVVYEPTLVAIVSGVKEAILDGNHHAYDSSRYLLCPMTMPVEAGTPHVTKQNPLIGVMISLDARVMRELALEMDAAPGVKRTPGGGVSQGLTLARWDADFTQALLRLVELADDAMDAAVLGPGRLRELYYAALKG
ncbi:AraC family transcriptional regulator, partial [Roseibium sp.]